MEKESEEGAWMLKRGGEGDEEGVIARCGKYLVIEPFTEVRMALRCGELIITKSTLLSYCAPRLQCFCFSSYPSLFS